MSEQTRDPTTINLILDQSAFVRGIGNIKRWFQHSEDANEKQILLNVFIPSYTLHELDFVKKGISMLATNARESIRFIDKITSDDEIDTDFSSSESRNLNYKILIESPEEAGPSWSECSRFKKRAPKIKEFPNYKTKFDSNLIGHTSNVNTGTFDDSTAPHSKNQLNDIQYENSSSYQQALSNSNKKAEMPQRLKYLIRTSIYKRFIQNTDWKLVTEDSITKIWLSSFGMECININEAELLIIGDEQPICQIDTSTYNYTTINDSKNKKKSQRKLKRVVESSESTNGTLPILQESKPSLDLNGNIRREKFQSISYAPRGNGELWTP